MDLRKISPIVLYVITIYREYKVTEHKLYIVLLYEEFICKKTVYPFSFICLFFLCPIQQISIQLVFGFFDQMSPNILIFINHVFFLNIMHSTQGHIIQIGWFI